MANNKFIAHPGQSLFEHLSGVGVKSKEFASKIGLADHGELIGLLHDLGKYSQEFQTYINSALGLINPDEDDYVDAEKLKGKVDHSTAGAQYIWETLSDKGQLEKIVAQILALCIASHHSGLIDCISPNLNNFGEDIFNKRMQKIREKTHADEAVLAADIEILGRCSVLLDNPNLIGNIKKLLGNIARNNIKNSVDHKRIINQQYGLVVRFLFSCLIDADRIDTADAEHKRVRKFRPKGKYVKWPVLIDRLESHLKNFSCDKPIDNLRREISQYCFDASFRSKGIFTLTVPTGGGKTLASLRFALHHAAQRKLDRIVYVIPFTSIIDQNAKVVRKILEPKDVPEHQGKVVLEHHSSVTPEQQTWREKILCENWDTQVVYTTMVQFLETLFGAGTRGARRMHQLANAVLIFDEVQSLPINCIHLFNNAINFLVDHCNSTVVLCTATQPLLHQVNDEKGAIRLHEQHEIMPDKQKLFDDLKRVNVHYQYKPGGWSYVETASLALEETMRSGSCLVIVNTKAAAKAIYKSCHEQLQQDEIFHLSTDMCPAHRKLVLWVVKRRLSSKKRVLCVSTQLIEAGVDIDFEVVIRFVAGLDSIAQAAGRCNRNGRSIPGIVHVINPAEENLENLPAIAIGRDKAMRVISEYNDNPERYSNNLIGLEALHNYYKYYFFERQDKMDYQIPAKELGHDDTLLNLLADNQLAANAYGNRKGSMPDMYLRQAFMSAAKAFKAIDAPTQGVIVPYGKKGKWLINKLLTAYDIEKEFDLLRKAQQYAINVFPRVLERLIEAKAVRQIKSDVQIWYLDECFYSDKFGIATEQVATMEALCV